MDRRVRVCFVLLNKKASKHMNRLYSAKTAKEKVNIILKRYHTQTQRDSVSSESNQNCKNLMKSTWFNIGPKV